MNLVTSNHMVSLKPKVQHMANLLLVHVTRMNLPSHVVIYNIM